MKKQGIGVFLRRKQYVIAGAIVAIAAVGTTMLYSNEQEMTRKQLEAELAAEMNEQEHTDTAQRIEQSAGASTELAAQNSTEELQAASAVIPPKQEGAADMQATDAAQRSDTEETETESMQQQTAERPAAAQTAKAAETLHFAPSDGMLWPMEGNVILNYSMDATTYFPTLEQYKYNPAVIIEGEVNDKVYSVAKGQVADISNNEVTGYTMTVDLGDGYQAIYGQLKELNFAKGDYVEAGHVLGYIAEPTKYFSVEGSNLYFALQKDGKPVDPVEFFE